MKYRPTCGSVVSFLIKQCETNIIEVTINKSSAIAEMAAPSCITVGVLINGVSLCKV